MSTNENLTKYKISIKLNMVLRITVNVYSRKWQYKLNLKGLQLEMKLNTKCLHNGFS
jgi:hypothetical protein